MLQLRKSNKRNTGTLYSLKPVMRVSRGTQAKFILSKLILEQLKLDAKTEDVMFGFKDKQLHIIKEKKDVDNYHLGAADASTMRFRSIELYEILKDFYNVSDDKEFYLELQ